MIANKIYNEVNPSTSKLTESKAPSHVLESVIEEEEEEEDKVDQIEEKSKYR